MHLSIYLLINSDEIKNLSDYVDNESIKNTDETYEEVLLRDPTTFRDGQALLMIQTGIEREITWTKLFEEHYNYKWNELFNQGNSAVFIIKHKKNTFAICFGMGYTVLKHRYVEKRFGIKTVLNSILPNKLKVLGNRDLAKIKRSNTTQIANGSSLEDFEVNEMTSWTKLVSGGSMNPTLFGRTLLGTERFYCKYSGGLSTLPAFLDTVMERYNSNDYKKEFSYLDHIIPINKDEPISDSLNKGLDRALTADPPDLNALYLSMPDITIATSTKVKSYHIVWSGRNRTTEYEEITIEDIAWACRKARSHDSQIDLRNVHVTGRDSKGKQCTPTYNVFDFIAYECICDGDNYAFFDGSWFRIKKSFSDEVEKAARKIPIWTSKIKLPDMTPGEHEGPYNIRASAAIGGTCMDKVLFKQRIESCDIFHKKHGLIHIKKGDSSSMLSHLFSQASVSAGLLRGSQAYSSWFREAVKKKSGKKPQNATLSNAKFAIAIASNKTDIVSDLFLFSKITLMYNYRIIKNHGYSCGLCHIKMS